ncbi:MAG: hypothetical protein AAF597_10440 [Bacteroidota bacterium]
MHHSRQLVLLLVTVLCVGLLPAQVENMPLMPAAGTTSYSNLPIAELNRAHRQQLTGQFEDALLTYSSALAYQPDWVPALTARATLYQRLGRQLEARRDQQKANRQNPLATSFFMARGHNGLLPFLALYPHEWYAENYGFDKVIELPTEVNTPQAYFTEQYFKIMAGPEDAPAVQLLRKKVSQQIIATQRALDELPRGYDQGVRRMLEANLALLNHDYPAAINLYSDAEYKHGADWPELYYNRGLGYILQFNYMNGCEDLTHASREGFAPAKAMLSSLCNF